MPTDTDVKLAEDLAEFRLETEKRFGSIETALSGIAEQLRFIRWIGVFFASILTVLVGAAVSLAWSASAVVSDVRYLQRDMTKTEARFEKIEGRLDRVEERLDGIDAKLDVLIRRGEAKGKGE